MPHYCNFESIRTYMVKLATMILKNPVDAEDIVQDVFQEYLPKINWNLEEVQIQAHLLNGVRFAIRSDYRRARAMGRQEMDKEKCFYIEDYKSCCAPHSSNSDNNEACFPYEDLNFDNILGEEIFVKSVKGLKERDKKFATLIKDGYSKSDASAQIGVSPAVGSIIVNKLKSALGGSY